MRAGMTATGYLHIDAIKPDVAIGYTGLAIGPRATVSAGPAISWRS